MIFNQLDRPQCAEGPGCLPVTSISEDSSPSRGESLPIDYAFVNRKNRKIRPNFLLRSRYFALDSILLLEAILP